MKALLCITFLSFLLCEEISSQSVKEPFFINALKNLSKGYKVVGCLIDTSLCKDTADDFLYIKKVIVENDQNVFFIVSSSYKTADQITCVFVGVSNKKDAVYEFMLSEKIPLLEKIMKSTNPKPLPKLLASNNILD